MSYCLWPWLARTSPLRRIRRSFRLMQYGLQTYGSQYSCYHLYKRLSGETTSRTICRDMSRHNGLP